MRLIDAVPLRANGATAYVSIVQVQYHEGAAEDYLLPIRYASGERSGELKLSQAVIAQLAVGLQPVEEGVVYDALIDADFAGTLRDASVRRRVVKSADEDGIEVAAVPARGLRKLIGPPAIIPAATWVRDEENHTSVIFGERLVLRVFRRLYAGIHPDLKINRFLNDRTSFRHVPTLAGHIELRCPDRAPTVVAILQGRVLHEADAWSYTLDALKQFFERCLPRPCDVEFPRRHLVDLAEEEISEAAQELIGGYLASAGLLGQRTGEFHIALSNAGEEPQFAPEPFTLQDRQSLYQNLRASAQRALALLRQRLAQLAEPLKPLASEIGGAEGRLLARYRMPLDRKITGLRLRCHGDYHLGRVLFTGKDFVLVDFSGEPGRLLGERRLKRPALRDVASMLRSFDNAARVAVRTSGHRVEDAVALEPGRTFGIAGFAPCFSRGIFKRFSAVLFCRKPKKKTKCCSTCSCSIGRFMN